MPTNRKLQELFRSRTDAGNRLNLTGEMVGLVRFELLKGDSQGIAADDVKQQQQPNAHK